MNNYNVIGRVGKDAVTRQAGNEPVTGWSLAVDSGYGDKKQTLWLDCSMWGKRGEKVAEYITKGSQLGVSGELGTREHEGKTYLTLRVGDISLIGGKPDSGNGTPRNNAPQPARRDPAPSFDSADDSDSIPFATNRSVW